MKARIGAGSPPVAPHRALVSVPLAAPRAMPDCGIGVGRKVTAGTRAPRRECRRRNSQVAYVPQSDVLIPSLTVQECLRYSALLRLPQDTSPLNLQARRAGGWRGGRAGADRREPQQAVCSCSDPSCPSGLGLCASPNGPASPDRHYLIPRLPQVHVERVLDELGLRHIADAQVGGSGGIRGVSGGERRR